MSDSILIHSTGFDLVNKLGLASSFDIGNDFVLLSIKVSVIALGVLLLINQSRTSSAATLHKLSCVALFAVLALPIAQAVLPTAELYLIPPSMKSILDSPFIYYVNDTYQVNAILLTGFTIYSFGLFWSLTYRFLGLIQLRQIKKQAAIVFDGHYIKVFEHACGLMNVINKPELKLSETLDGPATWGLRNKVIVLPIQSECWSDDRLRRVFLHELAHVKRNDWFCLLWVQTVQALFWFLPPVWILAKQIEWRSELACDDQVIAIEGCALAYAEDLKDIALEQEQRVRASLSLIERSTVFKRIDAAIDGSIYRGPWSGSKVLGFILMASVLWLALSCIKLSAHASAINRMAVNVIPLLIEQDIQLDSEHSDVRDSKMTLEQLQSLKFNSTDLSHRLIEQLKTVAVYNVNEPLKTLVQNQDYSPAQKLDIKLASIRQPKVRMSGYVPLVTVMPVYPSRAIKKGIEGRVIVQFNILENGHVDAARLVAAQPKDVFDRSVMSAIEKFKFRPQTVDGLPITVENVTETFVFKLDESVNDSKTKSIPFKGSTRFALSEKVNSE